MAVSVTHGGAEEESNSAARLYSKEVYAPTFRSGQSSVSPSYYSSPYSDSDEKEGYPISEYEEDNIVVPEWFL